MFQQKTTREIEIEKFITRRSCRKYTASLKGPPREAKAGYRQRQRQDLRHMSLSGCVGGVHYWGSQAKA